MNLEVHAIRQKASLFMYDSTILRCLTTRPTDPRQQADQRSYENYMPEMFWNNT